jgi:hypothetical protein
MKNEINKDHFSSDKFDTKAYLNNLINSKQGSEADTESICNFKMKLLQREMTNLIEVNTNNLLKAPRLIEEDLKDISQLNNNINQKLNDIKKSQIESKNLDDLNKASGIKIKNKNLNKAIRQLDKI